MSDEEEGVRVLSYSPKGGQISLCGLYEAEVETMHGVIRGQTWVTVSDGRLKTQDTRQPLPSPIEDAEMLPYWRRPLPEEKPVQLKLFKPSSPTDSSSIFVSHLCGYYYTPENYVKQVKLLESYGFECLRSRRGKDGKYWEVWFLPSLWSARGELKDCLDAVNGGEKARQNKAVDFLCSHVSFGTLDVMTQRAAMVMDD